MTITKYIVTVVRYKVSLVRQKVGNVQTGFYVKFHSFGLSG